MDVQPTRGWALALGLIALVSGCGASRPPARVVGTLASSGGELGTWEIRPDRCVAVDDGIFDLSDSAHPGVTLRVVGGDPIAVVLANRDAGGGPTEISLAPGERCVIHYGAHSVPAWFEEGATARPEVGVAVRLECEAPGGGRVSGVVGAGLCS